jgi:sugar lactone lactonase YvrE
LYIYNSTLTTLLNSFDGSTSGTAFDQPQGVCIDAFGTVWVADGANARVVGYDDTGAFMGSLTGYALNYPNSVSVDSKGNFYVPDDTNVIVVYNQGLLFVETLGTPGSGVGQFNAPTGSAVFNNILYVGDENNARLQALALTGNVLRSVYYEFNDRAYTGAAAFSPDGICLDAEGNAYVVDITLNRIVVFDANGVYVRNFGSAQLFNGATLLAISPVDGLLYVTHNNQVSLYKLDGTFVLTKTLTATLAGIAFDKDGNIYITNATTPVMYVYEKTFTTLLATINGSTSGTNFLQPFDVAIDQFGTAWVADTPNNRIVGVTKTGAFVAQFAMTSPFRLKISPDGYFYVSSTTNVIKVFDPAKNLIQTFGKLGSGAGNLNNPHGVALFGNNLYVADLGNVRVEVFTLLNHKVVHTFYYVVTGEFADGSETQVSNEIAVELFPGNTITTIQLDWTTTTGTVGYNVYRSLVEDNFEDSLLNFVSGGGTSQYIDGDVGTPQDTQNFSPFPVTLFISGSVTPVAVHLIQLFLIAGNNGPIPLAQKQSEPDGTFKFIVSAPRGTNEYYVLVDGTNKSQSVFVNAYKLHTMFLMQATELLEQFQQLAEQTRANNYLNPTQDVMDSNITSPTEVAIRNLWESMTSYVRPAGLTYTQYVEQIKGVLAVYNEATTLKAIYDIMNLFFSWNTIGYIPSAVVDNTRYNTGFRLGTSLKFTVVRGAPFSPSMTWAFTGGKIFFNNKWYNMKTNTGTFAPFGGVAQAMYVDGTVDGNGYLQLKTQSVGGLFPGVPSNYLTIQVPTGSKILGLIFFNVPQNDIIHIAGMGRLYPVGISFSNNFLSGPFIAGPDYLTTGARIRHREYKYTRIFVFPEVVSSQPQQALLQIIFNILTDIKPAKDTLLVVKNSSVAGWTQI